MTTASEKLRELGAGFDRVTPICRKTGPKMLGSDAYVHAKDIHAYVDVLPQIVALVEAAELKPTHVYVGIPMEDGRPSGRVRYPLVEALAALDEALS